METKQFDFEWLVGLKEIRGHQRIIESKENENTIYHNLCAIVKALLKGRFIAMRVYIKKSEILNKLPNDTPQTLRKTRTNQT
jgi:hypothetical protein